MTVEPPVLPPENLMVVTRLYQPAERSSGRAMVLTAPPEVRSVTRTGEARRVSGWVPPAFKAATLGYGPVTMAERVMGCCTSAAVVPALSADHRNVMTWPGCQACVSASESAQHVNRNCA